MRTEENGYMPIRSEAILIQRAIKKRWGMTPDERQRTVNRMMKTIDKPGKERIVTDEEGKETVVTVDNDREAIAAARVLVAIEAQDQADEHALVRADPNLVQPVEHQHVHLHQSEEPMKIDTLEQFEAAVKVETRMYHQKGDRGQV